jgi:ribonuclease HI
MPRTLEIRFDGACWPNPGGSQRFHYGWVLLRDGAVVSQGHGKIRESCPRTNNSAEFFGLMEALLYVQAMKLDLDLLEINGDSMLVVKLVRGDWRAKKPHLQELRNQCLRILREMDVNWKIDWIPREENTLADEMSNR